MKSQRHDASLGSGLFIRGKVEDSAGLSSGVAIGQKVGETISDSSSTKDSEKSIAGSNQNFSGGEVMNGKTFDVSSHDGNESVAAKQDNIVLETKVILPSKGEAKELDSPSKKKDRQTVSRIFPGAEVEGPNRRTALICDFYAKGWCIKGSSCRFLHVKDNKKSDLPQLAGKVLASCKTEAVKLEVLREGSQGSGSPSILNPLAASAIKKTSSNVPEVPKFVPREELLPLSSKETEIKKRHGHGNNGAVSSSHQFGNPSSHSRSVEELARLAQPRPFNYTIPIRSDSPGSSSSNTLSASGVLSSNGISSWKGSSSLPFSYPSISASHVGSRSSILLHGPTQISGSKPDKLPPTKRKISSVDWEPSVPFRPSLLIRSMISLPEIQYDPLQDSIDLPKVGDGSLEAYCRQGSSIPNTSDHLNNGEAVSENRGMACNEDTLSVSSHNTHHEKDRWVSDVEAVGTSTEWRNKTVSKRKNSLRSFGVNDVADTNSDARRQKHEPRDSLHMKMDIIRQSSQVNVENIPEQCVNKESRAVRQFRVALIEFVKELLKPKWREGHLSKDVHNKIVKKAVEKVLSTLPDEQVPTTVELVKQYLDLNRSKMDKLVEGYAEIYGKA